VSNLRFGLLRRDAPRPDAATRPRPARGRAHVHPAEADAAGAAAPGPSLKMDVIVANSTPAVQAAKEATATIPIVMASAGDRWAPASWTAGDADDRV